MAAPRVQARGGLSSVHYALIATVALCLTAIVLLVLLYTDQERLNNAIAALQSDNAKLISDAEKRSIPDFGAARETTTLAKLLEGKRLQTAKLITPTEGTTDVAALTADVTAAIDAAGEMIRGFAKDYADDRGSPYADSFESKGLLDSYKSLVAILEAEHKALVAAESEKSRVLAQLDQLTTDMESHRDEFAKAMASAKATNTDIEKSRDDFRKQKNEEIAAIEYKIKLTDEENTRDKQALLKRANDAKDALDEVKKRNQALQSMMAELNVGPQPLTSARKPDGRVVMAEPGDEMVYINLGRGDQIVPGMNFTVYAGDRDIPADGRGKARVQIQRVFPNTSEAKVVQLLGNQVVLEGDQIANPIYDRTRPRKFRIIGEFDLDGDGYSESAATSTFAAMIRDWGATTVDSLEPDVDFLILGVAPRKPSAVGNISPEQKERDALAQRLYDEYNAEYVKAQNLAVPIMTQDVFLSFLGYGKKLPRVLP